MERVLKRATARLAERKRSLDFRLIPGSMVHISAYYQWPVERPMCNLSESLWCNFLEQCFLRETSPAQLIIQNQHTGNTIRAIVKGSASDCELFQFGEYSLLCWDTLLTNQHLFLGTLSGYDRSWNFPFQKMIGAVNDSQLSSCQVYLRQYPTQVLQWRNLRSESIQPLKDVCKQLSDKGLITW